MTVSILPNGKAQFIDINGAPLVGGKVYFFVPSTEDAKDTWQDMAGTTLNTNPIILDERGQAAIWGDGNYRQRVLDIDDNEIWDVETSAPCDCGGGGGGGSGVYEVGFYFVDRAFVGDLLMTWNFVTSVDFPTNFSGAFGYSNWWPSAPIDLDILKGEDVIGAMSITDAGVVSFSTIDPTPHFDAGDQMFIQIGDPLGAGGISATFPGTLS